VPDVVAAIESDLEAGSVGVALEPAVSIASERSSTIGDQSAGAIPTALITAAACLTAVTVAVGGRAQAEDALQAGATGIMVHPTVDAGLRAVAADRGGRLWLTGITDPPAAGPPGERLIIECDVVDVPSLARQLDSRRSPIASARIACSLPRAASVGDGVLEALVTLALAGGATVLRCAGAAGRAGSSDVRIARRCADVAMELLCSGVGLGDVKPGGQGLAS
jgi:hypothetical protein